MFEVFRQLFNFKNTSANHHESAAELLTRQVRSIKGGSWLCYACLVTLLFAPLPALALANLDQGSFKDFDIISADKLNFKDGDFELTGTVEVRFGKYTVKTPKLYS